MMGNWQEVAHSVFLALVFAFVVAKVMSLVVSYRDDSNLRVERDRTPPLPPSAAASEVGKFDETLPEEQHPVSEDMAEQRDDHGDLAVEESKEHIILKDVNEESKVGGETEIGRSLLSDEDDWEEVGSTELDETFGAAASYVASMAANLSPKIPSQVQAQL